MANINEILARAESLRKETALNSIDPERAGGIMYDTLLALNELWLQQGAALVISKIYASVAAMEADTAPVSDLTGKPLRPGQIVVIASSDSDNGSVYRYNGTDSPSWSLVGNIGNLEPVDNLESDSTSLPLAAHQGKVLDGKISQLGQEIGAEIITSYELAVSSSSQSKRIDFAKAKKGRFKIAFDGGTSSGLACKMFLYNGSTAEQNLVWESERFGFNKWVEYSGNEFDIAIFTVYGDMVVTAGEANIIVDLGILSKISSLEERIDAGEKSDFALMVKTHGYNLSGSPVLDENGLLVQSGVSWADGSAGTLRKTNFNEDVLEYAVETVTHTASSKTVQYSYQFSELGEVTKETINIS